MGASATTSNGAPRDTFRAPTALMHAAVRFARDLYFGTDGTSAVRAARSVRAGLARRKTVTRARRHRLGLQPAGRTELGADRALDRVLELSAPLDRLALPGERQCGSRSRSGTQPTASACGSRPTGSSSSSTAGSDDPARLRLVGLTRRLEWRREKGRDEDASAVLTGGGDAPGLNAVIRAIVRRSSPRGLPHRRHPVTAESAAC